MRGFADRVVPQTVHHPGRVLTDLAVMIADGGECVSDIATLADQSGVFGPVATDSTCWRVLDAMAEQSGQALPASMVAGQPLLARQGVGKVVILGVLAG